MEERRKALDEYLGLYINYKLKVQAGYDEGLNTQPAFAQESKTFKKQIADNIINEEAGIHKLTNEAFQRGMKDIHAAQIFVEIKGGDTTKALQQINLAYKALQSGKGFAVVAKEFSTDAIDYSGLDAYRKIGWQRQLHLFEVPFYYIEYGIAQLGAIGLWAQYKKNPKQALQNYINALSLGGTKTLPELYAAAGLKFDLSPAHIKTLMEFVNDEMEKL